MVKVAPAAAPIANNAALAVALAAAASHGVNLLSGCCSLGSLGLRYASIARRRVSNAIVRDFRRRISSIRRSSLCTAAFVNESRLSNSSDIPLPGHLQSRPYYRRSPVARTGFKTLIYLKRFAAGACGGHGFNKQIFGAVRQVHIPNSELWDDCGTPFRGDATPIRGRYELDGSLCNANVSSTGLINSLFVALTKQLNA